MVLIGIIIVAIVIFWLFNQQKKEVQPQYVSQQAPIEQVKNIYIFAPTEKNKLIIQALSFIGKADGQFRQEECSVIIQFLKEKQPEHKPSNEDFMTESIRSLKKLSYQEYKQAINNMNKDSLSEFISWTNKIIGTQSTIHPFEEVLQDNLYETIKKLEAIN